MSPLLLLNANTFHDFGYALRLGDLAQSNPATALPGRSCNIP